MTSIVRPAPAKINLFLEICSRRPDGYHNIESVMQTVSLFDHITVTREVDGGGRITVTCTNPSVPCDETNLCHRAAVMFFEAAGIGEYAVSIHIDKNIPMAAGLGGGSSDAAAVLCILNELYSCNFTENELCGLGSRLGADVPFLVKQGISVTRGIGDVFEPCPKLPECYMVVACHGEGVSTPWAYRRLDEMYDFSSRKTDMENFLSCLEGGEIKDIANAMTNIFESAVLPERPYARMIRDELSCAGALRAMMSGSGPSVIGIFKDAKAAENAVCLLNNKGIAAHIVRPLYPDEI